MSDFLMLAVLVGTGLRVGEVTGLRWCDIDMDEGLATKKTMQAMEVEVLSAMTGLGH